ncbi:LysM domain-containing protein [Paramyrothecium foliicola]|nr:LysM domain-containing protein [Paramyrothecium foliicola]
MKTSIIRGLFLAYAGLSQAAVVNPSLTQDTAAATTTTGNGIETPLPTQPGMVDNCEKFYFVKPDDTCRNIAWQFQVTEADLREWNPSVGSTCTGIWANVNLCVRTIGYVPPESVACHTAANTKTWGDNEPAAHEAAWEFCKFGGLNGISAFRPMFQAHENRIACGNAPFGQNKFTFSITNRWGRDVQFLFPRTCYELLAKAIDGCPRGGVVDWLEWDAS